MSDRKIDHRRCEVEGCDRPVYVKGKCKAHYQREWKLRRVRKPCSLEGCACLEETAGLCSKHYTRQKEGKPLRDERELFIMNNPPRNGVGLIPLTQGYYGIVDEEHYVRALQYVWSVDFMPNGSRYAKACLPTGKRAPKTKIWLHRFVMGCSPGDGRIIDHKDDNGLDCRLKNLRDATKALNGANTGRRRSRSNTLYKGIIWHEKKQMWAARLHHMGKSYGLGYFSTDVEAVKAYARKALEVYGEFARLNVPPDSVEEIAYIRDIWRPARAAITALMVCRRSGTEQ